MEAPVRFSQVVAAALIAVPVGLYVTGASAQAQNTRDCKYYGICNGQQGYSNSYYGDAQRAAPSAAPRATGTDSYIHDENGLVGPHGVGW
jgi:hypothetical protein